MQEESFGIFKFYLFMCFMSIFVFDGWVLVKAFEGWTMDVRTLGIVIGLKFLQYGFYYAWKHVDDIEEV